MPKTKQSHTPGPETTIVGGLRTPIKCGIEYPISCGCSFIAFDYQYRIKHCTKHFAAPDLLQAAKKMCLAYKAADESEESQEFMEKQFDALEAAIAKAEGR